MILGLKARAYAIGAAILGVVAFFVRFQMVKDQRDKARREAEQAKTQLHVEVVKQKIEKEENILLDQKVEEIRKEVKKRDEDFEGLDNLNNPNDW